MKKLSLYDTMTRARRDVEPEDGKVLRVYCCGPTVYGPAHIGNFRSFLLQDVFRRAVESTGVRTLHVRNLTNLDDKTIARSQEEGKSLSEFTAAWTEKFHHDSRAMGMLEPHVEPGAVEHIPDQIAMIGKLVESGHAYAAPDGSVYFDVSSFEPYGALSRLKEREITTDTTDAPEVETSDEYERDSAADFALWKARRPADGDNFWPSPWGDGRPGWHLECSAMSIRYLGDTFDVHSGGVDLTFPHHENEIAQSEACTGKRFVRHWFHITHLMVEGTKMSKSLGNLYTLEDVAARGFTANELRYVLIAGHYRQPLNFTWDSLAGARKALQRMGRLAARLRDVAGESRPAGRAEWGRFEAAWESVLRDLNTPEALGKAFTAIREIEKALQAGEVSPAQAGVELGGMLAFLAILGVHPEEAAAGEAVEVPAEVRKLADERWEAKQSRDWAAADRLRDALLEQGWQVKDGKDGYELTTEGN